jgi:uncharacterized surface protein with fasciclin (FAS1) repeats
METAKIISKDILDTALARGQFKTLEKALKAADVFGVLKGKGPFTVFAPNDAAFAKLPAGKLEELLKPENKTKLADLLKQHVASGSHRAAELTKAATIKTLQGADLAVVKADGGVRVGGALVSHADIECSNGMIHEIDSLQMQS